MRTLFQVIISLFFSASLFAVTANDVAKIVQDNQSDVTKLCREGGVFRSDEGKNCENPMYGYIAFVICHKYSPDEIVHSQCGKNVTKNNTIIPEEIYNRFQTVWNHVSVGKEAICKALEAGNPYAFSRFCKTS